MTDSAGPLGTAVALAVASGLSLYGTAFVAGLAIRLGWVQLGPAFASLGALSDPVVLSVAGVLVSLAENGLVALAVWLALTHPLLALGAGLVALALAVTLVVWVGRRALGALARYRGRGSAHRSGSRAGPA